MKSLAPWLVFLLPLGALAAPGGMAEVPAGTYRPVYPPSPEEAEIPMRAFGWTRPRSRTPSSWPS